MAKATVVRLAAVKLNWLFQKVAMFELPEKVGDVSYDLVQRRIVKDECAKALRELKAYSPWAQRLGSEMRLVFGPADLWTEIRKDGKLVDLEMLHPERECEIKLSQEAVSGISWLLLTMLSVATKNAEGKQSHEEAPPIVADLYVWPIAEAIRRVKVLRESLNLDSSEKKRQWADDPDLEVAEAAPRKET